MGNVWGVAEPTPTPAVYNPAGDVACPAGAETTVITSGVLSTVTPGNYYPLIIADLAILIGAIAPTALVIAFKLGAGADVDTYTLAPALLVANATLYPAAVLLGANSGTTWGGAGATVNVTINPTGQAVTLKQVGSRAVVALLRGADI